MLKEIQVRKQIKKSKNLFWHRDKEFDYVTNGNWIIKTNLSADYRKILAGLVEIFGVIPTIGETIRIKEFSKKEPNINKITMKPEWLEIVNKESKMEIEDTQLIQTGRPTMRIFKGKEYIYINSEFLEMVDLDFPDIKIEGGKPFEPMYLKGGESIVAILPIRMCGSNKHLASKKDLSNGN